MRLKKSERYWSFGIALLFGGVPACTFDFDQFEELPIATSSKADPESFGTVGAPPQGPSVGSDASAPRPPASDSSISLLPEPAASVPIGSAPLDDASSELFMGVADTGSERQPQTTLEAGAGAIPERDGSAISAEGSEVGALAANPDAGAAVMPEPPPNLCVERRDMCEPNSRQCMADCASGSELCQAACAKPGKCPRDCETSAATCRAACTDRCDSCVGTEGCGFC